MWRVRKNRAIFANLKILEIFVPVCLGILSVNGKDGWRDKNPNEILDWSIIYSIPPSSLLGLYQRSCPGGVDAVCRVVGEHIACQLASVHAARVQA